MRKLYSLLSAAPKCLALFVAFILFAGINQSNAQNISNYVFSTGTNGSLIQDMNGNAIDMTTGTTLLIGPSVRDGSGTALTNLPFDFWVMGVRNTQFSVSANGWLGVGVALTGTGNGWLGGGTAGNPRVAPFLMNITGAGFDISGGTSPTGKIHYKSVGTAPNRTFVVEYLNMTIANPVTSSTTVDATFQARLYEATGVIEFVYGNMQVNGTGNIAVAIGFSNTASVYQSINPATHTSSTTTSSTPTLAPGPIAGLNSTVEGSRRYYRFVPSATTAASGLNFTGVTPVGMNVNWTDNATDELGYAVYRSGDGGTTWNYSTLTAASAVTYAQAGLNPATNYTYRVMPVRESLGAAISGSQATSAAGVVTSVASGNWSNPATWSTNAVPTAGDNVTIADGHTVTVDVAANAYNVTIGQGASGILQFEQTTARTLTAGGNVTVAANGIVRSNSAGTVTTHTLSVGGNLSNNGTIDFSTNGNTAGAQITFTGTASNTWTSGGSSTTNLRSSTGVTVNKGTSISSVLTFTPSGTFTVQGANTAGFLSITNGLFVLTGTATVNNPVFSAAAYSIPVTGGFQLNNANATVAAQNGSPTNAGLLRLTAGTFNIGTTAGNAMTGATGQYIIEGGTLNIGSRITCSGAGSYTQTGGTVNVTTITAGNATSSAGGLDFSSATSTVTITGGVINLITANTAATPLDYRMSAATVNITGGTLNVGTAATATNFNFRLAGAMPVVIIDNTTNNKTATLFAAAAAYGDVTVNAGTTLNTNGFNITLRGGITNNGTVTANTTGSGITFQGTAAQTLGASITSNQIANVTVNNPAGVTITPAVQVNTSLTLISGNLSSGGTLTLGNSGANNFSYTRGNGTTSGTVVYNYGTGTNNFTYNGTTPQTTGAELPATVATGTLTINNAAGVTLNSSFTVQNLTLTSGVLTTTSTNLITVTATGTSAVSGGSATAYVSGPLVRTLPASLVTGSTYTFPVGKSAYKLLELINPTTTSAGTVAVRAEVFDVDPLGTYTGFSGLNNNRYWQLSVSGAGAFSAPGTVRITETGLGGSSKIGQSTGAVATGTYTSIGGFVAGLTISNTVTAAAYGTGGNSSYFIIGNATAFIAGKYSIGPSASYTAPEGAAYVGTFANLGLAITAANNAGTPSGDVIFELQNDYNTSVETYPINVAFQGSSSAKLTIRPRSDVGAGSFSFSGANTGATFEFNTADYVTIDGRPGAGLGGSTKKITIENTATGGAAVRFINDATNNILNYCNLQGQNTSSTSSALSGVVYVSTGLVTGNDNITISNSDIHATGGGNPTLGIVSYGNTTTDALYNDNGVISNCNIYDVFSAASATSAVKLDVGNNAWSITNNNVYQTTARTYTTSNTHRGFWVTPNTGAISTTASGFVITGNYIGGSDVQAGSGPMTLGGTVATAFWGMDISVGFGTATSIQNNKITNIALTSTSGNLYGISQNTGNVNIGNVTGNVVGDPTLNGAITLTTTATGGGTVFGYRTIGGTGATINVSNNIFAGITTNGTATLGMNITGISIEGTTASTVNVTNNKIGDGNVLNSLNATATSTSVAQSVRGISVSNSAASTVTINNNTIINLNNAYTGTSTSAVTLGIIVSNSTPAIASVTGNKVRNLSTASTGTGTGAASAVSGICVTNTNTLGVTISQNLIDSLILAGGSATATVNATGLFLSLGSTVSSIVSRNYIHSLDITASNPNAVITGIDYGGGTATIVNNIVRLGLKTDGSDLSTPVQLRGITMNSAATSLTHNIWFNTIYIGGQNVNSNTPARNSYAIIKQSSASGTYDIRNNILVNNRSNSSPNPVATPPNGHYALYLGSATGNSVNYNLYQATGSDGYIGYNGTAAAQTYTTTWLAGDANSVSGDPLFVNPLSDVATLNLHVQTGTPAESNGVLIASVTDDFDGETRSGLSPTDIGADAGSFQFSGIDLGVTGFVSPAASGCFSATQTITVTLKNFSSNPIDFSVNNATVSVTATTPGSPYTGNKVLNTGTLAAGATMNVDMTTTANMSLSGSYTFNSTVAVTGDVNPSNNAAAAITRFTMGGPYSVGSGGAYPTITAAVADYNIAGCITSPVTFNLTDATYDGTTETFPIIINANAAAGTQVLTIKPALGNVATITGAVSSGALIRLNGADYVTIDGSNNGTNTQDLTISNTGATNPSGIALMSTGVGAGATNNVIKNCNISTTTNQTSYGIAVGGATPGSAGADNDNVTIQNNIITNASNGIYAIGTTTGVLDNLNITGNSHTTLTTVTGVSGIRAGYATGAAINQNTINIETSGSVAIPGISLETGFVSSLVNRNLITKVKTTATGGYGGRGIVIGTGTAASNLTISNNMISGITGSNWTSFTNSSSMGICIGEVGSGTNLTTTAGGIKIYYNSITLTGSYAFAGSCLTGSIYIGSAASAIDIRNNILVNSMNNTDASGTGSKNYAIYSAAASSAFTNINYNDYYVSGTQGVLAYIGSDRTSLGAIITGFTDNANSKNEDPQFVSATDLHIQTSSGMDGQGTPVAGTTTDFDGQTRDLTTPDIGADELPAAVGVDMRPQELVSPVISAAGCYNTETITVSVKNNSASTINFGGNPLTVTVNVTGAATASYSAVVNTGSLLAGAVQNVTMATPGSTLNMSTPGIYSFDISTSVAADVDNSNDLITRTREKITLTAGTIAASPDNYCATGGTPTLTATGAAGYSGLQWQQSTVSGSGYANILTATTNPYTIGTAITQTMYYRLVATCGIANDNSTEAGVVLNNPQLSGTTPGSRCGPGTVVLGATTSASGVNWYAAASGGTAIGTGTSFTTPSISSTTTFYAAASDGGSVANVGKATYGGVDGTNTAGAYLIFDATSSFTLSSVVIYPYAATNGTAGTVTIAWQNSAGTTIQSTTVNVTGNNTPVATTVPVNFAITPGTNYRLNYLASSGVTAMYRDFSGPYAYPFTIPGVVSITNSSLGTAYYYYFYNWTVTTGCEGTRTAVTATINTAPALTTPTATPPTICDGQSSNLQTSSSNAGYTYSWSSGGSGASTSVSPNTTTKYYVDAIDNSGGAFNGCSNRDSVTVTVNPVPSAMNISPSSITVCPNSSAQLLTVTGGTIPGVVALSENFNGTAAGWTTINNSTVTTGTSWTLQPDGYVYNATYPTAYHSNDNSQFYHTNADPGGTGSITNTYLQSPAFSTLGFSSLNLTYYNFYLYWNTNDTVQVQASTDGTNWTVVKQYAQATSGNYAAFVQQTVNLDAYVGNATVYVRFRYRSVWGYWMAIDNVLISGDGQGNITWSPTGGLFTDAAATSAYSSGNAPSIYAKPTSTQTYTASATLAGCSSTANITATYNTAVNNNTALAGTTGGAQVCANYNLTVSTNFFNNCNIIATVTPSGASQVSGVVNACVKIDASVQSAPNGVPYAQRHFDILPASNPTTATSTITLYFLQSEFNAFNAANGTFADLPTGGSDAAGKAALRITQYNGTGTAPGNYTGSAVQIDPVDAQIVFNATANRWEVTFDAVGSGGFYVHTSHFVLPVTLLNFRGEEAGSANKLLWSTSTETNNKGFELQRSADGRNFSTLGFVATKANNGNSTVTLNYSFDDNNPLQGNNYYRLKQVDRDGKTTYSNVVLLSRKVKDITLSSVYPNPATKDINLVITSPRAEKLTIIITDLTGKVVMQQPASVVIGENQQQLSVQQLAQGTYLIKAVCANGCETAVHRFVKQ